MFRALHRFARRTPGGTTLALCLVLIACQNSKLNPDYVGLQAGNAPLGSVYKFPVTQIPLPPGKWVELAREVSAIGTTLTGQPTASGSTRVAWGLVEDGKITVLLVAASNNATNAVANFWVLPDDCRQISASRESSIFLQELSGSQFDMQECVSVRSTAFTQQSNRGFLGAARQKAMEFGGLPRDAVTVLFAVTGNGRFVNYSISYFPERDSAPLGRWTAGAESPEEKAYVSSLVKWARGFRKWVVEGAHNRL